jgi:hypothetical protein
MHSCSWFTQHDRDEAQFAVHFPEDFMKNALQRNVLIGLAALGLSTPALADGLSATLEVPILPQFSVGGTLSYTYEVVPNLFLGGTLGGVYNFGAGVGAIGGRLGGVYVLQLLDASNTFVNAYVGAGVNAAYVIVPAPATSGIGFAADVNAGVFGRFGISQFARIYGGIDGALGYNFTGGQFVPVISTYAGVRLEPITSLEVYAQAAVGLNGIKAANLSGAALVSSFGAPGFVYDVRAGLYYQIVPQFQIGLYTGFNGGFSLGLSAKFTEKPGTLATPGNYLP